MPSTALKAPQPPRDLGTLIPALPIQKPAVDWPLGTHQADAARNFVAVANGRHNARRFTGATITGFGELP